MTSRVAGWYSLEAAQATVDGARDSRHGLPVTMR